MRILPKTLILLTLIVCAGCAKPSDIGAARRDHILAGPHGWIDITLHAPATASAPVAARAPSAATAKGAAQPTTVCDMTLLVDGEKMIQEAGDLARADAARSPLGYRFVVPAGAPHLQLTIAGCVREPLGLALTLTLEKGRLALLEFDGQRLAVTSTQAWEPATLEAVGESVAKLHEHGEATDGALSTLTKLVIASLLLNVAALLGAIVAFRRRSR
jgi:hypothetical protein